MSDKNIKIKDLPQSFIEKFLALKKEFNITPVINPAPIVNAPAPVVMGEAKLIDGTVLKYNGDTLAVGATVTVVTPEGEIPAPNGEHTLEDGTVIEVENGMIKELKAPEMPVAPVTPPAPAAQVAAPNVAMEKVTELEQKFAAITKEKESVEAKFNEQSNEITALKKQVSEIFNLVGLLMDQPTESPIETPAAASRVGSSKKDKLVNKFLTNK